MSVPKKDTDLLSFGSNFSTRITASPSTWDLQASDATEYSTLLAAFLAAYNVMKEARDAGNRSKPLTSAKDVAKAGFLFYARDLYGRVQSNSTISQENKELLGVVVRKTEPTPQSPPAMAPLVTPRGVIGKVAKFKLEDAEFPNTRRRPPTAKGATVLSFVGATPPPAMDPGWRYEGQTGRNEFQIQYPSDTSPDVPCWCVAFWYSARGAVSPACNPVQIYVQGGPVQEEEAA